MFDDYRFVRGTSGMPPSTDTPISNHGLTKAILVSDAYYELLKAHHREGETMEETLRRVTGGPDPRVLVGILDEDEAALMADAIENLRGRDDASRQQR